MLEPSMPGRWIVHLRQQGVAMGQDIAHVNERESLDDLVATAYEELREGARYAPPCARVLSRDESKTHHDVRSRAD